MFDRNDINAALRQAKAASQALRALLRGSEEPDQRLVEQAINQGAQLSWMSPAGNHQTDHAFIIAAKAGFADTIETMGRLCGSVPVPRGKSIFEYAQASKNNPQQFKRVVQALLSVPGYDWKSEDGAQFPALRSALVWKNKAYAEALVDLGAWREDLPENQVSDVLAAAMQGGMSTMIWERATPGLRKVLGEMWWAVAKSCEGRIPSDHADDVARIGMGITPVPKEQFESFGFTYLSLGCMRHGYEPPLVMQEEKWDPESPLQPFWRVDDHARWPLQVKHEDFPWEKFNFGTPDHDTGNDWLGYYLKEYLLGGTHFVPKDLDQTLEVLLKSGQWQPGHRDSEGLTAGFYFLKVMLDKFRPDERQPILDLIDKFDLFQFPIESKESGVLLPIWEDPVAMKLISRLNSPGFIEGEKAKWEKGRISIETVPARQSAAPRRM